MQCTRPNTQAGLNAQKDFHYNFIWFDQKDSNEDSNFFCNSQN